MLFKNQDGEVRLIWRLSLLVVPFLAAAYLLRYIPIRVHTEIFITQGLSRPAALSRARYLYMEDPVWSSLLGAIQGLVWYPLVFLVIKLVEKRSCSLDDLGLSPKRQSLWLIPLGICLALVMYFGYFGAGSLSNQGGFSWSPERTGTLAVILISLNFITNGFGEETAFRAYFQGSLIRRYGVWIGILLASSAFVLLHLLLYQYTGLVLLASIFLAAIYGVLFMWTGSIYLVGTMHAVFNLAPRLLNQWPPDIGLLVVHSLGLFAAIILYVRFAKKRNWIWNKSKQYG